MLGLSPSASCGTVAAVLLLLTPSCSTPSPVAPRSDAGDAGSHREDAGWTARDAALADGTMWARDRDAGPVERIATPPTDPCEPSAPLERLAPGERALRLPGGGRAFFVEDAYRCTVTLVSAPALTPMSSRVLAEPLCHISTLAGDVDGDDIDELLVEIRDGFASVGREGPHRVRAAVLDLPLLATRWESAPIETGTYRGPDFSPAPNDRFTFATDADADCRRDIVLLRNEGPVDTLPTRASVLFGPEFVGATSMPAGVPAPWLRHFRGSDFDGDGRADFLGWDWASSELWLADARLGVVRFRWALPAASELSAFFVADVDEDDRTDLFVVTHTGGTPPPGTTLALHGGDFTAMWELPWPTLPRAGGEAWISDLDAYPGYELETIDGWVDARTGGSLDAVRPRGHGAIGWDGIERPYVIDDIPILIEVDSEDYAQLVVRASDVRDGAVMWQVPLPREGTCLVADFTADGSVDVLVAWSWYVGGGSVLIEGSSGRARDLRAELTGVLADPVVDGSRLIDIDDDGAPEITVVDRSGESGVCYFRGRDLARIACSSSYPQGR